MLIGIWDALDAHVALHRSAPVHSMSAPSPGHAHPVWRIQGICRVLVLGAPHGAAQEGHTVVAGRPNLHTVDPVISI
jgi:hypothetical protein